MTGEERGEPDEVDGCAVKRVKPSEDKPQSSSTTPAEQRDFTYMGMDVAFASDLIIFNSSLVRTKTTSCRDPFLETNLERLFS